ncbi:branched-chain amino acid ABC transporter permease [Demequina sp. B12]|uniref:branched-chain amino acid ABC transporter permease n=1 Tax=Demequina sp. B12 TaxID=2992757 RepID=UPI00237BBBEA|nr:branched-chain amino acid ABC transporter permease [Demequina sp. B12]MDE0573173.1 branched-chain amino acid ABC transporter permease [Demequina sp. B12]
MTKRIDRRVMLRALIVLVIAVAAFIALGASGSPAIASTTDTVVAHSAALSNEAPSALTQDTTTVHATADTESSGVGDNRYVQQFINGIVFGLLLALASVGLSLIYGTTGLSNFAHGEQVSLGALLTFFFASKQEVSLPFLPVEFSIGWPLLPSALAAIAISAGTGWLQDRYLWSPLRRRRVSIVQQMIVSIGLSLAMLNFIQWWFGAERKRLTTSIDTRLDLGLFSIGQTTIWSVLIALVCLGGVGYFLLKTRTGRATRAVSDNPALASASGIRVEKVVRLVWIMATGLAAVGGILLALYDNAAAFDVGARLLLLMFAAVTLGGLGQAFGALVGSLVIGVAVEMSTLWIGTDLKYAVALAILILVLLVRPQGILGRAERVG